MRSRIDFHENVLKKICPNVYFQPPASVKMIYPCIRYSIAGDRSLHANDGLYNTNQQYTVTFITKDPDCEAIDTIRNLPYCSLDRPYTSDNLYHYPFTIFY